MGTFLKLIVFIGALWLVDALAFGGRYRIAIQEQAIYQGQTVRYEIRDWFKGIGL
jgi:hypothetical protein